tara:strand:+ start:93 stop:269 length:177 start_codon:yes stop_codon:yes gene_type:complete
MRFYKEQYYLTIICGGIPLVVAIIVGTPMPSWFDKLVTVSGYSWLFGVIAIQLYKIFK